ncbi:MAG: ATP:cob(I)alamin adenosyltransferase [Candidatus Shapirobacteria bacterium]|nr:ATP:cob(I)alamin adenosyltransferase [Candidatus Shapirobacteria bacterium]
MDNGFTYLHGKKQKKSQLIFEVLGDLDELNVILGLVKAFSSNKINHKISKLQADLTEIGSFLADLKKVDFQEKIDFLKKENERLINPSLKKFSQPGINQSSSFLHLARVVCRRLERKLIALKKPKNLLMLAYFNRLSSYLFWLAKKEEKI